MIIGFFDVDSGVQREVGDVSELPPVRRISVVLAKPTKACNADCSYCFAKPYDRDKWTIETFKSYFDKLSPYLKAPVEWIWHGGEPMMMGVDFFLEAEAYAHSKMDGILFSMQSNLTLLKGERWISYIKNNINGRIATSYDVDEKSRTIGENAVLYNKRFKSSLDILMENKIKPFVIGVFDDDNINSVFELYDFSKRYKERFGVGLDFRINPKINGSGNDFKSNFLLDPVVYGNKMVELLDLWINDSSDIAITPLDSFIGFYYSYGDNGACPWTNKCAGAFISVEPNGDVYNCDDMMHYMGNEMSQGNLNTHTMNEIFSSKALVRLTNQITQIDPDCAICEFYYACKGGCGALTTLNVKNGGSRYPYCATNKIIFGKIKEYDELGLGYLLRNKIN